MRICIPLARAWRCWRRQEPDKMNTPMTKNSSGSRTSLWLLTLLLACLLQGCGGSVEVAPEQFEKVDQLVSRMTDNIEAAESVTLVTDIDHARLGAAAGTPMAPTRVVIFSDAELESSLFALNPLTALDMPLRILAFAPADAGDASVIFNSFDYLVSRYSLAGDELAGIRTRYEAGIDRALAGIPATAVAGFPTDVMQPDGITTIASPFNFKETLERVVAAIDAQDDTMHFGAVSFPATDEQAGAELLLFGAPGPGARGMKSAQTLGLDGFCQKFLVWENSAGDVFLSFNDLLALAERQGPGASVPLRVIDFRLGSVFEEALTQ